MDSDKPPNLFSVLKSCLFAAASGLHRCPRALSSSGGGGYSLVWSWASHRSGSSYCRAGALGNVQAL